MDNNSGLILDQKDLGRCQLNMRNYRLRLNNTLMIGIKTLLFFIIIAAIALLPIVFWETKTPVPLNIVIIDKTVPTVSYREHKGLMWLLNNLKYYNWITREPFRYDKDYFGFFPKEGFMYDVKELPRKLDAGLDLIYITDSYGVYTNNFYNTNEKLLGERSELLYGGMEQKEIDAISKVLPGKTLIGEFNIFESPTEGKTRQDMEKLFGVQWSGWIGRYFKELSKDNNEIPLWLVRNYEAQYKEKWDFRGPGFAFVRSDDTVFVLKQGKEVGDNLVKINFTSNYDKEFGVKNNIRYYYWFDVLEAESGTETIAKFKLDTQDEGEKILSKYGLKNEFPAIVRKKSAYTSYYFAGDFADIDTVPALWNANDIYFINRISTFDTEGDQSNFYWKLYYPLMKKILEDVKPAKS